MMMAVVPGSTADVLKKSAVKGRSLWDDSRRRLFANKAAVAGMMLLALLTLVAFIGPLAWPHSYEYQYQDRLGIAPTSENMHWLGTDILGRDMVARLLIGLQISLAVGFIATFVSLVIGVAWGAVAGFAGGRVDQFMMRIVDVLYAVPFIFFVILVTVVFGRHIFLIFLAIGAVEWMTMARIVRGQTLALKQKEFVEAARAAGVKPLGIIVRHILPNLLGPVAVYVTLTMPVPTRSSLMPENRSWLTSRLINSATRATRRSVAIDSSRKNAQTSSQSCTIQGWLNCRILDA